MEGVTARDSGAVILAKRNGIVDSVDSERIIVRVEGEHIPDSSRAKWAATFTSSPSSSARTRTPASTRSRSCRRAQRVTEGPGDRRRSLHRSWRAGAGTQRAGGLHAVARIQLRRRDPGLRKAGEGGLLHLDSHRGVRDRSARHQAGSGRSHARHSQRQRVDAAQSGRSRRHPHRRRRSSRATSWSAKSRPRAKPSSRRKKSCCAPSSAKRPATCATLRSTARRESKA